MATQAEIAVLKGTATEVKNESQVGGNTAARVGGLFEGIVDALPSDEAIDGKISQAVNDIQPIVIEGNVDNAPDQEDLTSVNQGGTDVLKFKNKSYAPALFSGLGRVYLRKNVVTPENLGYAVNLLTAEMVSEANTIYHIQYDYDLNGQTITLPAGCVLEFDGGSLTNGKIVGNDTFLLGDVKVNEIGGSFKNDVFSTYSNKAAGFDKLKMLCGLNVDTLVIDEDYDITNVTETIYVDNIRRIQGHNNEIRCADCVENTSLLRFVGEDFGGLNFDFNDKKIKAALIFSVSADNAIKVHDISITNIKNDGDTSGGVYGISMQNNGHSISIKNVTLSNLIAKGDGNPASGTGMISGIYIKNSSENAVINISDVHISHILNVDTNGNYINDDAAGIYIHNDNTATNVSMVSIADVETYNVGRRVIKTDCAYLDISNVSAKNDIDKDIYLAIIGMNDGNVTLKEGNANIRNIKASGRFANVVATSVPNTSIVNCSAESIKYNTAYRSTMIFANNANVFLKNVIMKDVACFADTSLTGIKVCADGVLWDVENVVYTGSGVFMYWTPLALDIKNCKINTMNPIACGHTQASMADNPLSFDGFKFVCTDTSAGGKYGITFGDKENKVRFTDFEFSGNLSRYMDSSQASPIKEMTLINGKFTTTNQSANYGLQFKIEYEAKLHIENVVMYGATDANNRYRLAVGGTTPNDQIYVPKDLEALPIVVSRLLPDKNNRTDIGNLSGNHTMTFANTCVEGRKYELTFTTAAVSNIDFGFATEETPSATPTTTRVNVPKIAKYVFVAPNQAENPYLYFSLGNFGATHIYLSAMNECFVDLEDRKVGNLKFGRTADRPNYVIDGYLYFDKNLGKYICYNGLDWVNLDGSILS